MKIPLSGFSPYHVTARCINREWFNVPLAEVWPLMEDYLFFIANAYKLQIYSFVLMANHFHLIVKSPNKNLGEAMNYFMRETSRALGKRAGRINQTYGSRFHRTLLSKDLHFHYAYKYVYRNPVKAGIVEAVENYRYSTLSGLLGKSSLHIPIPEDPILFGNRGVENTLKWLNSDPPNKVEDDVKKAMRRGLFKFSSEKSNKKSSLEQELLY